MKFYEGMKLPDLTGFRGETVETPNRSLPRPLDMKALTAMKAAAPALAKKDPGAYVAHLFFSRLGLRNIEIVNARTHWISDGSIGIMNRPEEDFFPKGCEGWVPIAPDVLKEILAFSRYAPTATSCQAQIGLNGTMQFIAGIQNGFRSGSRTGQKRVTNCDVMPVPDYSTWARQYSMFAIFCGTAMSRQLSSGMHTVFKIVSCARSECVI